MLVKYVKSAVGYYLRTHPQHTLETLPLFEQIDNVTPIQAGRSKNIPEQRKSTGNLSQSKVIQQRPKSSSNDRFAPSTQAKSPITRAKTPSSQARPFKTGFFQSPPQSNRAKTPSSQTRTENSPPKTLIKPLSPFHVKSTSTLIQKSNQQKSIEAPKIQRTQIKPKSFLGHLSPPGNKAIYNYIDSRCQGANSNKKTPEKRVGKLNQSFDETRSRKISSEKKKPIENKLSRILNPKTQTANSQAPADNTNKVYMVFANKSALDSNTTSISKLLPEAESGTDAPEKTEQKSLNMPIEVPNDTSLLANFILLRVTEKLKIKMKF